jgi:hemolysin III
MKEVEQKTKPSMRGVLHQAAFYSSIGAGLMLIARAQNHLSQTSALVYVASLVCLFGVSALYHRPTWGHKGRLLMRKLDHTSIYFLIAGSATPIFLLGLPAASAHRLVLTIWIVAIFGAFKSFFWPFAPRFLSVFIYIAAGFVTIPYLSQLKLALGTFGVSLLLTGAMIYVLGALVYAFRKPNPYPRIFGYHEVFHAMVVIASAFHFKVIYDLVRGN